MRRVYLLVFFFLSGISGLIYEIAWVRQASLTFGVSVYAYSAVLAAYMIGLALGSYLMGKRADESKRPLRTYALLEIGIAVVATLSPFVLTSLNGFYAAVSHALNPGLAQLTLLRLVLSIVVLTPATILIGATLPIMSRIYATHVGQVGSDVGRLYLVNTAGAVLGCLLTGIFLIRLIGLRETVFLGATLNLLVAAGALSLARLSAGRQIREQASASPEPGELSTEPARPAHPYRAPQAPLEIPPGALRYVAVGYAISGFIALGYEVVWARILSIHTLHAAYSFSLMLTVFLTGLAVGSALGTWWLRHRRGTLTQFGILMLGIGLLSVLALFVFARLPAIHIEDVFGGYSITREILYELLLAFITLFPATLLIGALFPIVSSLYTRERTADVGLRIGTVTALNTVGAIAGSLGAGFVLIPHLGLRNTCLLLSAGYLALGTGALWLFTRDRPRLRWAPLPILGLAVLATFVMPPGLYLGFREGPSPYLVFYKEGVETTVAVFDVPEDRIQELLSKSPVERPTDGAERDRPVRSFKVSFVNGRDEVPTDDVSMIAFRLLGHLPPLLRPHARNALMLSFGNGIATGTLNTHDIPTIDAVDLSREMIEAAKIYREENYDVLHSDRLRLHVEDARNFLMQTDDRYDIITTDATHPSNANSWILFTEEFYELVQQRLSTDGVFMQWLPIHSLSDADYQSIMRTFRHVFPHTTLWFTGGIHSFLVATPRTLTEEGLKTMLAPAANDSIVVKDLGGPVAISKYLAMYEKGLGVYVGSGPLVTDNNAFFLPIR
ncbi:MAG: fused MFS/spermidine synthase [Gemmatimonadales bacterium]